MQDAVFNVDQEHVVYTRVLFTANLDRYHPPIDIERDAASNEGSPKVPNTKQSNKAQGRCLRRKQERVRLPSKQNRWRG